MLIAQPDQGTGEVMIRMGVERSGSDYDIGRQLYEPGGNLLYGRHRR